MRLKPAQQRTLRQTNPGTRPRGFIYILVLSVALLLATIGFSALTVSRIHLRSSVGTNDWQEAGLLAQSAIEYAMATLDQTPSWRTTFQNNVPMPVVQKTLGRGTMSAVLVDEYDGNLGNYGTDPVRLYGIGRVGDTTRAHSVEIRPSKGMSVLKSAAHSGTRIYILSLREVLLSGGLISSNDRFRSEGYVYGDSEAITYEYANVTTGNERVLSAAKVMPGTRPIDVLKSKATTIPVSSTISGRVLGPDSNPWGTPNPDGLYYLNAGQNVTLSQIRLWGTLIIRTGSATVTISDSVFFENYRSDYPTLIVEGNAVISLRSAETSLSEATANVNFNPMETPYEGQSDSDKVDSYPNEIRGLVHVTGEARFQQNPTIRGVLLAAGDIVVEGTLLQVAYNKSIYENPPLGYGDSSSPMVFSPTTWQWDTVP